MRTWQVCVLLLIAASQAGCMRTRHIESNCSSSWDLTGPCPSEHHESKYDERRWCGFWPFCPERRVFARHDDQ